MAEPFEPTGFYWSGFLCLVLAVLKLTVEAQWSWWRVLLPFWAVLGHNLLYITLGFAWLYFADVGATEEGVTMRQGHGAYSYQIAALAGFAVLLDNVLRRIEGQEETIFLGVRSGGWEVIFAFWGTQCRSAGFCSSLTVWISVIGEPTEGKALRSVDI